jgi:non-lysosomal glucosylceramidase
MNIEYQKRSIIKIIEYLYFIYSKDAWSVKGASAYCGGLHLASLKCVCEIAKLLNDYDIFEKYDKILNQAKKAYNDKLWNGQYYQYDSSNSKCSNSIMYVLCDTK